jgi:ferric-dicitrate binding protein FerR (iron transport regulator)
VITLSIGLYKYYDFVEAPVPSAEIKKGQVNIEIIPGSNKALLTLADGKQIVLEDTKSGLLAQQENTIVNKENDSVLVYSSQGPKMVKPQFNTISIPRGGQYQVVLPDGTKVWLNASSSLRFPTAFNGIERHVELSGEAYFEVKKDKDMPFIVTVINKHQYHGIGKNNMRIEVLGTHFNVMAYEDESNAITTLLEGSVKVGNNLTNVLLKPGQQALFNKTDKINISVADTEGAVAWKNGYFKFSNENIRSIMNKISRWYDVDIEYKGKLPEKTLWGTISRFEDVSEVLKTLELTGSIHFKLEGRRLIVME